MLLWFVGGAVLIVWAVFQDPAIDFRLVIAGAILPDVIDAPFGGARAMHSLTACVGLLLFVMLVTRRRRRLRRQLLAVPIGSLIHLVLDGMWTDPHAFWWPFLGWSFGGARLPSLAHPALVVVVEELAGAVALAWAVVRFRLAHADERQRFLHTGHLGSRAR